MGSYHHLRHSAHGEMADATPPMEQLGSELGALVDRLEADLRLGRCPDQRLADELRRLRQRAERLFENMQ